MKGIDNIRQYLGEYKGNYVIIGGTACNLNLEDANIQGRATKAYLNNIARRQSGQRVQSEDIDKHKRDAYRMAYLLTPEDRFMAPEGIRNDIRQFLTVIENDPINTKAIAKNMGLPEITQNQFMEIIIKAYSL